MPFRDLILAIFPKHLAKAMEEDSKLWMLVCPKCSSEISFWDIGGIRYKAKGNPKKLRRCLSCNEVSWHSVKRREAQAASTSSPSSMTPK